MAEAAVLFLTVTAFGILLGRSYDGAALALCLTLLFAVIQIAN
jgi:heme/copper-type cytochrome/quinol oxidase subunit 4